MRAINSSVMKQSNRKMVLEWIRRRPISRAELSDCTQLTRASITQIVDELMEEGLVTETESVGRNKLGRKQTQLAIVKDAMYIAGVNLRRKGYDLGVINLAGEVLWQRSGATLGREVCTVLDEIAAQLMDAVRTLEIPPERFYGVGVGAPGPLDRCGGTILNPPNFRLWHNVPIVQMLKARTGWNAFLANVSNAHALEELYFGIGREGVQNFMLLRVDEGVGAGIVLGGRLFSGPRGQCPEIGHVSIDRNGPACACGRRGCWERYISFPAVLQGTPFTSWPQVIDALDGNPDADALFARVAENLAFEIANIANVFGLDRIVLSGNFVYGGDRLAAAVNRKMQGQCLWEMGAQPVLPGRPMETARIAAMAAYHSIFSSY
ncbi:MAG: ROK family transcriptional regulator [Clostridia bacterium]|nr:ROK family transcriptional regulator [Clostridia bacterium]